MAATKNSRRSYIKDSIDEYELERLPAESATTNDVIKPRVDDENSVATKRQQQNDDDNGCCHQCLKVTGETIAEVIVEPLQYLTSKEHRPYFTYWITAVQIILMIISLASDGFGPIGIERAEQSAMVMTTALALEAVDFYEPSSFWVGPRAQHLIRLGAQYTPCMRRERQIVREMHELREQERQSACCVRNDGSGCVQSTEDACSRSISRWLSWPDAPGSIRGGGWTGGSVCGLDPRYCQDPTPAVAFLTWNRSDITTWPKCRSILDEGYDDNESCDSSANGSRCRAVTLTGEPHMTCELLGRPCCYGIRGQCRLATRDFCDFVRGYYHEDAFLCSQVACLEQVCGMLPFFVSPDVPDQFYRLVSSLFLHAGVFHLLVTIAIHLLLLAKIENEKGWRITALIYILSGVAGNLVSAIFLPDVPSVGPSGSLFALFAARMVHIFGIKLAAAPWKVRITALFCTSASASALSLLVGTLPWLDNFQQIFGYLSGLLLYWYIEPPWIWGNSEELRGKIWKQLPLIGYAVFFASLVGLFYLWPLDKSDCPACSWLNCVPFYADFCNDQNSYFFSKGYSAF